MKRFLQEYKRALAAVLVIGAVFVALWWQGGGAPASVSPPAVTATASETAPPMPTAAPAVTPTVESSEEPVQTPLPEVSAAPEPTGEAPAAETPKAQELDPATGTDQYLTEAVPEGKPLPVEPQEAVVGETARTCTLSVRCDTILTNLADLKPEKAELVPVDGVIFPPTLVTFYEGESVFNLLQREMRRNQIHLEFVNTPIYNSAYIEGIHNLYEFDCGNLSGWMYKVNGWFPNYGCSRYSLQDGDLVEWVYTCDLGRDVGGEGAIGGAGGES